MSWVLIADKSIYKQIRKFPKDDALRIIFAFEEIQINPYLGDIKKMKGEENVWRKRIGNFRIKYEIYSAKKTILIFEVERRTSKNYRRRK